MSSDDSKLKLVPRTPELSDFKSRNYWNTSGLNKEYYPSQPRPESIPTFNKQGRVLNEPKDEWWINSKEHHYCFWNYLRSRSQPDGSMEPLLQSEIAELFGCSSTKVHFMLKEAMDKLMTEENMQILQNLLQLTEADPDEAQANNEFSVNINDTEEDESFE